MIPMDEMPRGFSHQGLKRKSNEDRFLIRRLSSAWILAVADGVGGHRGGDIAAQIMVDVLADFSFALADPMEELGRLLAQAEAALMDRSRENPSLEGMGTTLTFALVGKEMVHYLHVGDSRLYWIEPGQIKQLTTDQTFLQDFIDEGSITPSQAKVHPLKDMLDQCVGMGELEPEMGSFQIQGPGILLLCTDGLSRHLSDDWLLQRLDLVFNGNGKDTYFKDGTHGYSQNAPPPLEAMVKVLIEDALDQGGQDNITLILARVEPGCGDKTP
ncbi:MAG: protein phosphatase 2C domain-containing protein [Desulfobacterales bacterium]|nr:protein phosphatase 2C domain-containing protein [Desulfobacterales bacterium]